MVARGNSEPVSKDFQWCMVGKFLADKNIDFLAMKSTLASLWRPVRGVCIRELEAGRYLFQFFHELDFERVMDGGPWTFSQNILLVQRITPNDQALQVPLTRVEFWVQIHNLPTILLAFGGNTSVLGSPSMSINI